MPTSTWPRTSRSIGALPHPALSTAVPILRPHTHVRSFTNRAVGAAGRDERRSLGPAFFNCANLAAAPATSGDTTH